jgi:hypothetical protein
VKRFVVTTRWSDPWFRRLSPVAKLLWSYLTDHCDCVGLIDLDVESAAFHIGAPVQEKHLTELSSRLQRTIDGKLFIPRFIPFQYGTLSETCPAHKPVLKLVHLRQLSTDGTGYQYPNATLPVGLPNSTGKGKDKEKDKEEGESEGEIGVAVPTAEDIYQAYPRKVAKPEAIRAIQKALKSRRPEYLLAQTVAYARTRPHNDQFTPFPATWFNQCRFNDDPATWEPININDGLSPAERKQKEIDDANDAYREKKRLKAIEDEKRYGQKN